MTAFAEIDANGWAVIIGAVSVLVMQVVREILAYHTARRLEMKRDAETDEQLRIAKKTLEVTKEVHVLANGPLGAALASAADLSKRIVDMTGATKDRIAADKAQVVSDLHKETEQKLSDHVEVAKDAEAAAAATVARAELTPTKN